MPVCGMGCGWMAPRADDAAGKKRPGLAHRFGVGSDATRARTDPIDGANQALTTSLVHPSKTTQPTGRVAGASFAVLRHGKLVALETFGWVG